MHLHVVYVLHNIVLFQPEFSAADRFDYVSLDNLI